MRLENLNAAVLLRDISSKLDKILDKMDKKDHRMEIARILYNQKTKRQNDYFNAQPGQGNYRRPWEDIRYVPQNSLAHLEDADLIVAYLRENNLIDEDWTDSNG